MARRPPCPEARYGQPDGVVASVVVADVRGEIRPCLSFTQAYKTYRPAVAGSVNAPRGVRDPPAALAGGRAPDIER